MAEGVQDWSSECGGHTFPLVLQAALVSVSYPKATELSQACHSLGPGIHTWPR